LLIPTQSTTDGHDFYFMGLDSSAIALKYGSYFGGALSDEHVDGGTSRFDPGGRIYQSVCAGCGGNDDFPVTPGAWPGTPGNPNHAFNCNNGVVKLDFQLQLAIATINTNTLSGCSPLTVTLTNATPPAGSTATFTWDLGNGNTSSSSNNPVVTYTNPGTYTVQLTVEDNQTCNKTDRTKTYITVLPKPAVTLNVTGGQCTNTILATQTSTGSLSSNPYAWNFGDGSPVNTQSTVSYTYPGNGTYTISLTVTDQNGCTEIATKTITIFNFSPGAVNSSSLCYGSSTNVTATGGTSYTWSPAGSLNNNSLASPLASPLVTTIYSVQILNNTPGYNCGKTLTTQVQVQPTPTTAFSYSPNPCGGDVLFYDNSFDDIQSWLWTLAPNQTSTLQNTFNFYKTGGTFTISLQTTNSYGCKDVQDTILTLPVPPPVSVNASTAICRGNFAQLNASGGLAYDWTPPQTLDFPLMANPIATPPFKTTYSVVITTSYVVNSNPCKFLLLTEVDVDVLSSTQIGAYANPVLIVTGENSTLTYVGDPGAVVLWLPPGSTTPATGYTVLASPDRPTTYTASASRGACEEDVTVQVDAYSAGCLDNDAFVPNTFTPNGDGENDIFRVKGIKVTEIYFAVYNRWGEKVFETNDLNKGWDGTYKGKPADVGVFGWYLKVKCINEEETFKKGNVTLIR
jgi:gliding motility-associated-like protein